MGDAALAGNTNRDVSGQGSCGRPCDHRDPRSTSASRYGFTPTWFVARTPHCHVPTSMHLENVCIKRPGGRAVPEGTLAHFWSPRCFSGSARLGSGTNPTAFRAALPGYSRKLPSRTAPEVPSTSKPISYSEFGGCYPPRVREGMRPCRAAVVRHTGIASTPFLLRAPRP